MHILGATSSVCGVAAASLTLMVGGHSGVARPLATAEPPRISMEVGAVDQASSKVVCKLVVSAPRELDVAKRALPWNGQFSATWVAVSLSDDVVLARALPVDSHERGFIRIEPGQVLTGVVDLEDQFPDVVQRRRESDIAVFWTYRLDAGDAGTSNRQGGWLLLPKQSGRVLR
jgi:hypothetical protein